MWPAARAGAEHVAHVLAALLLEPRQLLLRRHGLFRARHLADAAARLAVVGLARLDHLVAGSAQPLGEQRRLGGLAAAVDSLEDEQGAPGG